MYQTYNLRNQLIIIVALLFIDLRFSYEKVMKSSGLLTHFRHFTLYRRENVGLAFSVF